jgi:hypothetical protein
MKRDPNRSDAENEAILFVNSMRGKYIISQALEVAIKQMEAVPSPYTEVSNIADMKYLRSNFFTFPVSTERMRF